jgi:hypothetical protein
VVDIVIRHKFNVDFTDRLFYAQLPVLGYLLALLSAGLPFMQSAASAKLIAAALLTLLFAAIRNAWDMMLWLVIKATSSRGPP